MIRAVRLLPSVVVLAAVAACRTPAPEAAGLAAPELVQTFASGPVVAVALVQRADRTPRILALAQDGSSQWYDAGSATPGPGLPTDANRMVAVDLDADARDEVVVACRDRVAAFNADGRLRWEYPTGGARILDLAAADLGGAGEVLIFLAGQPPVGLVALAPDGQLAWRAATVRTGFSIAPLPAEAGTEGALFCAADDDLVTRFDVLGKAQASWLPAVGPERRSLQATDLAMLHGADGRQLLVLGRISVGGEERATWAKVSLDGTVLAAGELPALPDYDRARPITARFSGDATAVAAVPTRRGEVHWLRTEAPPAVSNPLTAAALCTAVGPEVDGRPSLLVGTATGLLQIAFR